MATTEEPPKPPPSDHRTTDKRRANLNRALPEGVERGPDGRLRKKEVGAQDLPESPAEPVEPGGTGQLADMRHVYERPESADRTEGHRHCRGWLKEDRKGFMAAKTQLEAKAPKVVPPGEEELDAGTARCIEVAEQWLEAHKG